MSDTSAIRRFVDQVEAYWAEHGMSSSGRRQLAADLERDLEEAVRHGAVPADLVEDQVGGFARELASANGIVLREPAAPGTKELVIAGALGGVTGLAASWFGVLPAVATAQDSAGGVVLAYGLAAVVTVGGVVAGVASRFRRGKRPPRLLVLTGAFTVIAGVVSIVPIKLLAAATGYSTAPLVLFVEAGLGGLFVAAAVAAANRLRGRKAG